MTNVLTKDIWKRRQRREGDVKMEQRQMWPQAKECCLHQRLRGKGQAPRALGRSMPLQEAGLLAPRTVRE